MRPQSAGAHRGLVAFRTVRFTIEAQVDDEGYPSGHAITPAGVSTPFTGWLGLLTVIQALLGADPQQPGKPTRTPA